MTGLETFAARIAALDTIAPLPRKIVGVCEERSETFFDEADDAAKVVEEREMLREMAREVAQIVVGVVSQIAPEFADGSRGDFADAIKETILDYTRASRRA